MGYADKVFRSRDELIRLFTSKVEGEDAWYILQVADKNKLAIYLKDVESGKSIDLPNYGKVLHKGWGAEPPKDIVQKIEEEYNQ